jgi:hypothetical protein
MNLPRFTAQASLYVSSRYYRAALTGQGSMINNPKIQGCWTDSSSSADQLYISEYLVSRTIVPSACPPVKGECPKDEHGREQKRCWYQDPKTGCSNFFCCANGKCCPDGGCINYDECCEDCSKYGKVCSGGSCVCPPLQKNCGIGCCPFTSRCTSQGCVPNPTPCGFGSTPCGANCCARWEHCCPTTVGGNICCPFFSDCTLFGCSPRLNITPD